MWFSTPLISPVVYALDYSYNNCQNCRNFGTKVDKLIFVLFHIFLLVKEEELTSGGGRGVCVISITAMVHHNPYGG